MRIRLHNIGPLRDADVLFRPLTILVGPNGSGKTTFTTVAYAIFKAHEVAVAETLELLEAPFEEDDEDRASARELVTTWEQSLTENLAFELRRCCSPDLAMLGRAKRGGKNAGPRISISSGDWCVVFRLDGDDLWMERDNPEFKLPRLGLKKNSKPPFLRRRVREALTGEIPRRAIYFPAGRSGIVQTHTALSALMAGALSGGYFKDATVGVIPGPTADFMQLVAQIRGRPRARLKGTVPVAQRLERDLLRGKVRLDERAGRREFLFHPSGYSQEWPVENMATAVAEFTPLVLYLRYRASPGDAILIDEPESHLHPESQVSLATGLTELASVISPVVVATHSEFLVAALSNLMLQQAKNPSPRHQAIDQLSVYAFRFREEDRSRGSVVESVDLESDEGFAIRQFSEISEQVFDEAIRLYNDLHADPQS
jgi:energy-coupling factor transporter ATP-binding protein EcfA2